MMHWASKYIGYPYLEGGRGEGGVDCWGLLFVAYLAEFGIALPEIPGVSAEAVLSFNSALAKEVERDWVEIEAPVDGCAVAMSQKVAIHHVGIWAEADGGKVVHSWKQQKVIADTLKSLKLKGMQTIKFYRHRKWKL